MPRRRRISASVKRLRSARLSEPAIDIIACLKHAPECSVRLPCTTQLKCPLSCVGREAKRQTAQDGTPSHAPSAAQHAAVAVTALPPALAQNLPLMVLQQLAQLPPDQQQLYVGRALAAQQAAAQQAITQQRAPAPPAISGTTSVLNG